MLRQLCCLVMFLSVGARAQINFNEIVIKNDTLHTWFGRDVLGNTPPRDYLIARDENLNGRTSDLQLILEKSSPLGTHMLYRQTINGIPVYGSSVKLNLTSDNIATSSFLKTFPAIEIPETGYARSLPSVLPVLSEIYPESNFNDLQVQQELMWYWNVDNDPVIINRVTVLNDFNNAYEELLINEQGQLIGRQDMRRYYVLMPEDSTVQALVYNPDPVTTANVTYGGLYKDNNDQTNSALDAERQQVSMVVSYNGGIFSLQNDYFKIVNLTGPNISPVTSTLPEFFFDRSEDGFEDVNAFYHLNTFRNYITHLHSSFNTLADFQIQIDTHADEDDVSYFITSSPPRLLYGEGGVDDAEDADVIIHEFGHALSYSANGGTNNGYERQALDEGLGDYFAASYSRALSPNRWADIFTWDGHNEFFTGRQADVTAIYPENLSGNSIHTDGQIFSSSLMKIWDTLGREITDLLVMSSVYGWTANMTMSEAAVLILQADASLFPTVDKPGTGQHFEVLQTEFVLRGFLEDHEDQVANSMAVLNGPGGPIIYLSQETPEADIQVFDLNGRLIYTQKGVSQRIFVIPRTIFTSSGMYIVRIYKGSDNISGKILFVDQ